MEIIGIVSLIVAILGIYPLVLFIISYINRPNLIIGILPIYELQNKIYSIEELGKYDAFDEFHFNNKLFAKKGSNISYKKMSKKNFKNRTLFYRDSNKYTLPVIFNNVGRSDLLDYNLVISFRNISESKEIIKILDVKTECAKIGALYSDENYIGNQGKSLIPSKEIQNYYNLLDLTDHMVILNGCLESYVFEMFTIDISVPKSVKKFFINYKVYPINKWDKSFKFSQIVEIVSSSKK